MKIQVKTEGLEGDALKFAQNLNDTLKEIPEGVTKADIDTAIEAFKTANPAPTPEISKAAFDELTEKVNQMAEAGKAGDNEISFVKAAAQIKENKDTLKQLAKGKSGTEEVVVKALTLRSAVTDNESAYDLPVIEALATRKLSMYDALPKITLADGTNSGTVRYYDWDADTIARAAAAVAEGAAFPESTAKFKKYAVDLEKIGDILPVTEEFFEDEQLFAAELGMFLETNVKLEVDRQLADGDGTSNTIVGLKAAVTAYTPAAAGIADANIYDLIVDAAEDITTAGGSKFMPDVIFASRATINQMKLKKDANYNYVLPPFVSRDGNNVDGMTVIESNIIGANKMIIGDRKFAVIYEKPGIVLSKGYTGDQFKEDELTLKARKRMLLLVKNCNKGAFRYISDIATALSTLSS